jgi:WbqC-like protein family
MQPTFLPWQGYFALIANADHFIFLDDFQFVRRSFMHRNRLFLTPNNPNWVSLPVEHVGRMAINQVRVLVEDGFRDKFLTSLQHAYAKSPFLAQLLPQLRDWISREWPTLADLNIEFIQLAAG